MAAPEWVAPAAYEVAVMERNALKFLLDADNPDDVETAHAVVRLARGLRRKLEWWQKREALVTAGQR